MKPQLNLYGWKEYSCTICKAYFTGNKLYKYPTQWGYDLPICKNCYKEIK